MSDELVKLLRSTYHATTPRKINTLSAGQTVVHTVAPAVVYRNPDGPAAAAEIERLTAEVRRLDYSTTHTCWDECPRLACAQRREIEALTAQLAEARESERAAVVDWLRFRLKGYTDPWSKAADAIEAREHLTRDADPVCGTIADSDGDDGA